MTPTVIPDDPESTVWDVVVIGTGMGGGTCGFELARSGRSVLFLERGLLHEQYLGLPAPATPPGDGGRLSAGFWPEPFTTTLDGHESTRDLPVGCSTGGGSAVYGMVLERFFPEDFHPRAHHPLAEGANLPDHWPISYDELEPFYSEVEGLFRVRGTPDPLRPHTAFNLMEPPKPSEKEVLLADGLASCGLHPYRLHYACERKSTCNGCGNVRCPNICRNGTANICLRPALANHAAHILPQCRVIRLNTSGRKVVGVECDWRGQPLRLRANVVILAAGAFNTPRILLRSASDDYPNGLANSSGMVGKNLMLHVSDFFLLSPKVGRPPGLMNHGLSFNDYYVNHEGRKLGNVHIHPFTIDAQIVETYLNSRARLRPAWWRSAGRPLFPAAARIGAWLRSGAAFAATVLEDLPYEANTVLAPRSVDDERIRFEYTRRHELRERSAWMREDLFKKISRRFYVSLRSGDDNLNYAHVCGTCRFGDDPRMNPLDRNNRAHDLDNLYITDSSFFPSSGGINPSLTIAANAMRVARAIDHRL